MDVKGGSHVGDVNKISSAIMVLGAGKLSILKLYFWLDKVVGEHCNLGT